MSNRNWVIALAVAVFAGAAGGLVAQIEKPAKTDRKSFTKEMVLVVEAGADTTATLTEVEFQKVNEKMFLVGTEVESEFGQAVAEGSTTWIPFDDIRRIVDITGHGKNKKQAAKAAR